MLDWEAHVRSRLAALALDADERNAIVDELAEHLAESYEELCGRGIDAEEAAQRVCSEVTNWVDLCQKIQAAKGRADAMPERVKQLWIPGLLTLVMSMALLALLQEFGPKPWVLAAKGEPPIAAFCVPWFVSLLPVGALAAWFSHRAGGSRRAMFFSIVFPVMPFFAAIAIVAPISLLINGRTARAITPTAFFLAFVGWVVIPAVGLLAGGLPMEKFLVQRLGSRRILGD